MVMPIFVLMAIRDLNIPKGSKKAAIFESGFVWGGKVKR